MASSSLACTLKELEKELIDTGNKLLMPPSSIDELLDLLDKAENLLSKVGQDPPISVQDALLPLMKALIGKSLLEHSDINVKVSVVSCITEVSRITAPAAPYSDKLMEEIFKLVAMAFEKLSDASGRCYSKAVNILENAARVRFCVLLLDLECEELLIEIFQLFLNTIRLDHPHVVYKYMEDIMTWIIEESDNISPELLRPILASLKRENQDASPISSKLGAKVLRNCAARVKPYLRQAVKLMSLNFDDYAEIVASICEDAIHRVNVETEEFAMDALHLVEGDLSADGLSKSVLENGNTQIRNSNTKEENSLRTLVLCDQIEQLKKADRRLDLKPEKLNLIGDAQREDDAGTFSRKRASEEPASGNAVVKMEEGIFNEAEGKQERLLQQIDVVKQVNDKSTFEKHGTEEVGGEVSVSPCATNLVANDDNFSDKCATTKSQRKRGAPRKKEESKKRSVIKDKGEELVGMRIKIWWPLDRRFYEGVVSSFDPSKKKHKVLYADGDEENLNLSRERWELLDDVLTDKEQKVDVQSPAVSCSKNQKKKAKVKLESSMEEEDTIASPKRSQDKT